MASLHQIAESINLESIESHNLAEIEPCLIFPQERLYKAFKIRGKKKHPVRSVTNSGKKCSSRRRLANQTITVCDAGVEGANGVYTWLKKYSSYWSVGEYEDVRSFYRVHKEKDGYCGWKLDVLKGKDKGVNPIVLYTSERDTNVPPSFLWNLNKGRRPLPYNNLQTRTFSSLAIHNWHIRTRRQAFSII